MMKNLHLRTTRMPTWLKSVVAGAAISVMGWAVTDRIRISERISTVEQYMSDSITRLERIERKVDAIREHRQQ